MTGFNNLPNNVQNYIEHLQDESEFLEEELRKSERTVLDLKSESRSERSDQQLAHDFLYKTDPETQRFVFRQLRARGSLPVELLDRLEDLAERHHNQPPSESTAEIEDLKPEKPDWKDKPSDYFQNKDDVQ